MKKCEEGVTLIQTIIAVVMIAILACFAIFNSRDTIVETKLAKVYNEIKIVKSAVMDYETLIPGGMKDSFSEDKLDNLSSYPKLSSYEKVNQEYYLLDFKNDSAVINDILEIRNVENNYIVNVKNLDDIEIFSVDGIEFKEETLYEDDEIIEKYNHVFAGR